MFLKSKNDFKLILIFFCLIFGVFAYITYSLWTGVPLRNNTNKFFIVLQCHRNKSDELKNQKFFSEFTELLKSYLPEHVVSSKTWTKCWSETFFMKNFFVTIETRSVRKNKILKRQHRNTTCRCIFQLLQQTLFSFILQNNNVSGCAIYSCIIFYLPHLLSTTKTFTFMFIFPVSPVSHSVCRKNQETAWWKIQHE